MAFQPRSRRRTGVQLALALLIILVLGVLSLYMDTSGIQKRTAALHEEVFLASGEPDEDLGTVDHEPAELAEVAEEPRRWGAANPGQHKGAVPEAIKQRCALTLGTWCVDYLTQKGVPAVTAPRGSKTCSMNCNKVGVCNALTGHCTCPAGWRGFNCIHPMKRYCTHKYREWGFEVERTPPPWEYFDSMHPRTHCVGFCEETIGACYCPSNTTYGRIPAREDAPMDAPPQQHGRPMNWWCQPNNSYGGTRAFEDIFGPQGWCMAAEPVIECECNVPGWGGRFCDEPMEQFCFNSCNGRGECIQGYCKCQKGWHGLDCAHRAASNTEDTPGLEQERPWLAENIHTPAAQDFAHNATRKRPLIFIYELESDYGSLMMQYRHVGGPTEDCVPRRYTLPNNETKLSEWPYGLESAFLEMLMQSEHRTLDPEEADFFYVPVFTSCFIYPVRSGASSLQDWFYAPVQNRVQGAANMLLEAFHWIQSHHPWWERRGGRDHIWLVTHDEGSCWVPAAIRPSIILSHWGRMDLNHSSTTGYWEDDYSSEIKHDQFEPDGFQQKIAGHACYDPVKDLVVPLIKTPNRNKHSPLFGAPTRNRTWLAFHRGRVNHEFPRYSRGVRQRVDNASREHQWLEKYNIAVGSYGSKFGDESLQGDYSELLASSIFCLVLQGDGWSARMDDAMSHGCIPVVIIDDVHVSFESVLDLSQFSLRVKSADVERLPEILQAVSQERREELQRNLARVWQRYSYSSWRPYAKRIRQLQQERGSEARQEQPLSLPETVPDLDPLLDDGFYTIMGWLYSRIDAT